MNKPQTIEVTWIPIDKDMEEFPLNEVLCCNKWGDIQSGYLCKEDGEIVCYHDPYVTYNLVAYIEKIEPYKVGEENE